MASTKSINGVEIFSTGIWNNNKITLEVLEDIVSAFKSTSKTLRPFLKIGHNEEQEFLQKDGLPAAGWINNLYIKGNKLIADFIDIPKKVFELIEAGAYRKVSSEIYSGITIEGVKHSNLLGAVALLGSDIPAVMNLADILANYKNKLSVFTKDQEQNNNIDIMNISYSLSKKEGFDMPDKKTEDHIKVEYDLKKEKERAETLESTLSETSLKAKDLETENAELKQFKLDAEKKIQEEAEKAVKAEREKFISDLEKSNLSSPSMKPILDQLLVDKKEYKLDGKEATREDLVKGLLKFAKEIAKVNFVESSVEGEKTSTEDGLDKKISEYAKENEMSYAQAYKIVMKESKDA